MTCGYAPGIVELEPSPLVEGSWRALQIRVQCSSDDSSVDLRLVVIAVDISTAGSVEWPIGQVWSVVSDFADLAAWHPLIEGCEADGSGFGALRKVFFSDRTVVERLDELDEARHRLVYRVVESTRPVTVGLTARITLSEREDLSTYVEWLTTLPAIPESLARELAAYYPRRIEHLDAALAKRFGGGGACG